MTDNEKMDFCGELCKYAEDIINRPKAEIEALINGQETLQNYIAEKDAEIERLKKEIDLVAKNSISAKYPNCVFCSKGVILTKSLEDYDELIGDISAEAYREFAERLEKELFIKQNEHRDHWMETLNRHRGTEAYKDYEWSIDNWLRGYGEAVQDILAINQNFLKELEGEDDG